MSFKKLKIIYIYIYIYISIVSTIDHIKLNRLWLFILLRSGICSLLVFVDKPSPPQGPLEALETSPTAITVQWKPPLDDGGAKIKGYILEKKPKKFEKWLRVPGTIPADETQGTTKNLEPGDEYDFRVIAVNANGESEPFTTSKSITAKYSFGESILRATIHSRV